MNEPYRVEYLVQILDIRKSDGRGALIRWNGINEIFFTFADDVPFGILRETVGGRWQYKQANRDIALEKNRNYHVIIEVLWDKVTMQVNGKKISYEMETPFPHSLELKVQRGGTIFKNIFIKNPEVMTGIEVEIKVRNNLESITMNDEELKEVKFPEGMSSNKGTFKLVSEQSCGLTKKYKKCITCEDNSYTFFVIQKELAILKYEIKKIDIKSYDTVVTYAERMFPEGNEISWSIDILQFWNELEYLQDDLAEMKSDGMGACCPSIVDILDDLITMQFSLRPYINYYLSHEVNTKDGFKIEVGDTVFFSLVKSLPPFGDGRPNIRRGVVDRIMSHYAVEVRLECPYVFVFDKIYHVKNNLILDEIRVWRSAVKELSNEIELKYEIIEALEGQICPES